MTCDEAELLLHALLDGELDAGHSSAVEAHLVTCPRCAAKFEQARELRAAVRGADLQLSAPPELRRRIEALLPHPQPQPRAANRRDLLRGFAAGSAISALAATGIVALVVRNDEEHRIVSDVVSAHLRSLQAGHLTDVLSSEQHTVKPWFNGRLAVSPPVVDLTAQGFTLIGGRLDYIEGRALAAIVYRRRIHVINVFVTQNGGAESGPARSEIVQGFSVRSWTDQGLRLWVISDLTAEEMAEFQQTFESALRASKTG